MYWIVSLHLMFGILFARRTLLNLHEKNLIRESDVDIGGAIVLAAFFCVTDLARNNPIAQMLALTGGCALLLSLPFLFERRLRIRVQSEFHGFLSKIILEMKSDISFRAAIDKHLAHPTEIWEQWLRSMIESRVFLVAPSADGASWWSIYERELRAAEENPHLALTRLENFRRNLRILSEFRRKSGQALAQARIQMAVMTVLYLALLSITATQFRIGEHRRILSASITLFMAGQMVFWWLGRKRKWKT